MPSLVEKSVVLLESPHPRTVGMVADLSSELAAIVTHPWGPLGGNMHNNVVVAATLYLQRLGITTVRFDFVGGFSRGYVQVQQVTAIAEALLRGQYSNNNYNNNITSNQSSKNPTAVEPSPSSRRRLVIPKRILLVGYSYGSLIGVSASADIPQCVATVSIAPPFGVAHWLFLFHAEYHYQKAAAAEQSSSSSPRTMIPRLWILGDQDNFTSESVFQKTLQQRFPSEATTGAILKGADHFFQRREKDVMDIVGQWLLSTFPQCQGDLMKLANADLGVSSS
jgi:hypothetical protein